jgi:uncharacterized protein YbjT (DUF2867 family)
MKRRTVLLGGAALALLNGCATAGSSGIRGHVLVAGGSGRAGRYVVRRLVEQGVTVRATTRSRADALAELGPDFPVVDWIECDVRDPVTVVTAMRDIDQVISVVGANTVTGDNTAEAVDYGGVRNLVDAARAARVRHFTLLTAIGVTDPAHPFNKATKGALTWRYRGEQHLRASGIPYTIVRPGGLINDPAGQRGLALLQGDNWQPLLRSTLSRDDLALVLIESLRNPALRNVTLELVNDAALPVDAWRRELDALRPDP